MTRAVKEIEVVGERARAEVLLHPLRLRVLEAARTPSSSAEIARRLELSPQKVNYHVRRLEKHGFLRKVEERRAGNVVENVYGSTAESYVLASEVLGGLSPKAALTDVVTASHWLALQARAETELREVLEEAGGGAGGGAVPTLSLDAELRFETAEQRAMFASVLREVVTAVVSEYASPARTAEDERGSGRAYRLIVGVYPIPGWRDPALEGEGEGEGGSAEASVVT